MQIHKERIARGSVRKVSCSPQDDRFLIQFQKTRERNRAFEKLRKYSYTVVKQAKIQEENKKIYNKITEINERRFVRDYLIASLQ